MRGESLASSLAGIADAIRYTDGIRSGLCKGAGGDCSCDRCRSLRVRRIKDARTNPIQQIETAQ